MDIYAKQIKPKSLCRRTPAQIFCRGDNKVRPVDEIDGRIISIITAEPRITASAGAKNAGISRATWSARLSRLEDGGALSKIRPSVDLALVGYPFTAIMRAQIRQGMRRALIAEHLIKIPQVVEAQMILGDYDVSLLVAARDNKELSNVIDRIGESPMVIRTSTSMITESIIPYRAHELFSRHGS
ncbi:Lrp/AsnC family transcriptional regulator [Microbacterium maritypicum]|uniref:Lrp/AsnC family transcriptional regulator n=1 Tax=Microbacterium maritypicum TaxID=33918 RepID=UPI0038209284